MFCITLSDQSELEKARVFTNKFTPSKDRLKASDFNNRSPIFNIPNLNKFLQYCYYYPMQE